MSSANLAADQVTNTGWSQAEINRKGGLMVFVCPAGYLAVDSATDQVVSRINQDYRCKQQ
jgi:hypothetical protein